MIANSTVSAEYATAVYSGMCSIEVFSVSGEGWNREKTLLNVYNTKGLNKALELAKKIINDRGGKHEAWIKANSDEGSTLYGYLERCNGELFEVLASGDRMRIK